MTNQKNIYQKVKSGLKKVGIAYLVLGALSMPGLGKTGHVSSDICTGKAKLTELERKMYEPIFERLGIETTLFDNN
jgi:hypothetical protein